MLYFDHNATHPLSPRAREAWLDAVERFPGNPSSPHRLGSRAEAALQAAREKMAGWLGGDPLSLIWTAGATEANNAIMHHLAHTTSGAVWIAAIEHPSMLEAARRHLGKRHALLPVDGAGRVDVEYLRGALRKAHPAAVVAMAANNETGVLQPWEEMRDLCAEEDVIFCCDAVQWVGKEPVGGMGRIPLMSGSAHKFGGPQGVGFVKVPNDFVPLLVGGPQEEARRAGTENVAGILATVAALEERLTALDAGARGPRLAVRERFEAALVERLPGVQILGAKADRLWNTVAAILPEAADCRQRWVVKLDKLGFAVSTGSACASGKEQVSHVLTAMGIAPAEASRVLRFSAGWETPAEEWDQLLGGLEQAWQELRP